MPYPVRYQYDDYGRMSAMTTYRTDDGFSAQSFPSGATGDTTVWHYHEASGLLAAKEYADGSEVTYTYGTGGRLATRVWARNGLTTSYAYDAATGELTGIDYSDETKDIAFEYDRLGRQKEISDAVGTRTFAYNDALQLESEAIAGLYDTTITRNYEIAGVTGRAAGFNLGNGYSISYGYEATTGRMATLGWSADGQADTATYDYVTDSDLLASVSSGSGRITTYGYEPERNLKTSVENAFNTALISNYAYTYDELGRRTAVANTGSAFTQDAHSVYAYNDRSELTGADRYLGASITDTSSPVGDEQRAYQYDPIGNREQMVEAGVTTGYTANDVNQYTDVTGPSAFTPTYDADGNLQNAPDGMRYTYNAENRLIAAGPETPTDGATRVEFVYDYMGRRVQKTVYAYGAGAWQVQKEVLFVYDGWNLVKETTSEGGSDTSRYFVWGLDLSQSVQGAGGVGGLLAAVDSSLTHHYLYDANGNVGQVVNAGDGSVAAHYEYDPFGSLVSQTGDYAEENPYRFSTKYQDAETTLYYYGYRYYSTELGRWINRDPLGEAGGLNLQAFIFNDPANLYDIFGLACNLQDVAITSLKGAVAGYLKSLIAKKVITTGAKVVAAQIAPVAGQVVGVGMTAWEVVSFGRTAYIVYTNSDRIKETLREFYEDPKIKKWIDCLTPEECNLLAEQLGEVLGSFVANRKEMREGVRKIKAIVKRYASIGKSKYKNSRLANEIGAVGYDINASKKTGRGNLSHADDFDKARNEAFENAGMTNPDTVKFSKYDPETGTVVEFKGETGAKVAYDSPHVDMDPKKGHDKPHVGWQSGGKQPAGGHRGNVTYDGPQHPSRPNKKY